MASVELLKFYPVLPLECLSLSKTELELIFWKNFIFQNIIMSFDEADITYDTIESYTSENTLPSQTSQIAG